MKLGVRPRVDLVPQQERIWVEISLHLSSSSLFGLGSDLSLFHQVHFAEKVDMRNLEVDHGAHGAQYTCKVFGLVVDELRLEQICRTDAEVILA